MMKSLAHHDPLRRPHRSRPFGKIAQMWIDASSFQGYTQLYNSVSTEPSTPLLLSHLDTNRESSAFSMARIVIDPIHLLGDFPL